MRAPQWLRALACWARGHNIVGVKLPPGWSTQTCRTCEKPVQAFGGSR